MRDFPAPLVEKPKLAQEKKLQHPIDHDLDPRHAFKDQTCQDPISFPPTLFHPSSRSSCIFSAPALALVYLLAFKQRFDFRHPPRAVMQTGDPEQYPYAHDLTPAPRIFTGAAVQHAHEQVTTHVRLLPHPFLPNAATITPAQYTEQSRSPSAFNGSTAFGAFFVSIVKFEPNFVARILSPIPTAFASHIMARPPQISASPRSCVVI
ncbi:hypothetical protein C8R46DRAFT_1341944 [Mycena filopes]|nr:hypothetical protein C8R46DRAFT_1341944 [Mycena filopes]